VSAQSFQVATTKRIDQLLADKIDALPSHAPRLKQAMKYSLMVGGKRMRPFLVYATGQMLGVSQQALDAPAIAIEAIHTYSLIHDDLPAMDDDDLRRGHPTNHIEFDEATAILAGDALQTFAFEILCEDTNQSPSARLELVKIVSRASGYLGMCGGQAMDIAATDHKISQHELQNLHSKKTGALLTACVEMAIALATNVSSQDKQHLMTYAQTVGLAFQVQDDILDVVGDSATLGKPQGSDQELNKSTYPSLLGLEPAKAYLEELHQQSLQALAALPYNTEVLKSFTELVIRRTH
jgi:farnesyl diphosphate synthase